MTNKRRAVNKTTLRLVSLGLVKARDSSRPAEMPWLVLAGTSVCYVHRASIACEAILNQKEYNLDIGRG